IHRKPHELYQSIKKKIRAFHNSEGPLPIKEITKQWVKDFIVFMMTPTKEKKALHNNTTGIYFKHLRTILQEAVEQEIIPFNAAWLIGKKDRPKIVRADADSLTFEEIQKLTKVKRPKISREGQLMFLFSCFTGLRLSDCVSLKWNQIYSSDESGGKKYRIRVKQIKTQSRISNSLSDSALTIIEQLKLAYKETGIQSDYVFPNYCPEKFSIESAKSKINNQLKRWGTQAEIDHRMHFHLARHTYATLLMEEGNDIAVVQQLLGHKDIRATMIYAHVSSRRKEIAVNSLPKINSKLFEKEKEEKTKPIKRVAANRKPSARKQNSKTKKKGK
ncbi:MAG TPA: site-specific integrase, partial [Bacteroidia bacterium]|nr:site-specific integrase [Bacteroidia bacterium]